MKHVRYILTALMLIPACVAGQWTESNSYNRPLTEVLPDIEKRYGVRLVYENKNVKDKTATKADWKFGMDVETTLDNVLKPLELRWEKKSPGVYEIKKWEYFRKSYDEGARHLAGLLELYPSRERWETRRSDVKENIYRVMGLNTLPKNEIRVIASNRRAYDGYTIENLALEILPGVWTTGSLYMPARSKGRIPFFLSPHGHFYNNVDKSIPDERGRYRPDQQIRCAMLAKMGAAVFSYDMFAWGESALAFKPADHRTDVSHLMQTWQSVRILDYFCTQKWIDTARIGATGASGGGSQVMVISAIDDRITLSVPVVMMSSHFFGGCPCESGMPIHFIDGQMMSNNVELAAMMAPKPLLVVSDGNDWTATVPEVEMPYLKTVYGYYDAQGMVENVHLAAEKHDYGPGKRNALYDFAAKHFGLDNAAYKKSGTYDESGVTIEPAVSMYVFGQEGRLPEGSVRGLANLRKQLESYKTKQ